MLCHAGGLIEIQIFRSKSKTVGTLGVINLILIPISNYYGKFMFIIYASILIKKLNLTLHHHHIKETSEYSNNLFHHYAYSTTSE